MKETIAQILLEKKAVALNLTEPYTYVSGIRSPIYCDNRVLTYFPEERSRIVESFVEQIKNIEVDVIVGIASSAISWAVLVADRLGLPMAYVRKASKGYGKDKLIEGGDINGKKVIVIEDLVSTGGSSLNAVKACREAGAKVLKMCAIFTYEFEKSKNVFSDANCEVTFLTDFSTLVDVAKDKGILTEEQLNIVSQWNKNPGGWGPANGFPDAENKTE